MRRKLRPYQELAIGRVLSERAVALYMEMRLGKTLCAIRGLARHGPVLVVAPMVGLWAWKRELALEGIGSVCSIVGSRAQRLAILKDTYIWNLINYEGLRVTPEILEKDWGAIVLDECRRISNPKAKITKLLTSWSATRPMTRKVILSGNPAPESPLEYFEQIRFLHGQMMRCTNYWQFRNYYFRELGPHEWVPRPGATAKIKEAIHDNAFVLTRKEAGIGDQKVYERRVVELPPKVYRLYNELKERFCGTLNSREISTKWVPVQYMWLQQLASGHIGKDFAHNLKVNELVNLLQGELRSEPVVVWYRFNYGVEVSGIALRKARIPFTSITGKRSNSEREQAINGFRMGKYRVLLCQVKCASMGIDLSNSSTAIYFSNSHSLDDRVQSEDRILNPAKKEPLLYIDLVAKGTVDEDIVDALRDKKVEARFFLTRLLQKLRGVHDKQNAVSIKGEPPV